MKAHIFSRYSVGEKIIQETLTKQLTGITVEHLGAKVDLSRIKPEEQNLIIVVNNSLYSIDLDKIIGYIRKDLDKPLVVVKKIKTFGTVAFNKDRQIADISTNKVFLFAGILFLPKEDIENKLTMAEVFRGLNNKKENVRVYITSGRR